MIPQEFIEEEKRIKLYAGTGLRTADENRYLRLLNHAKWQLKLLEQCEDILSRFDVNVLTTISRGMYQELMQEMWAMNICKEPKRSA